MSDLVNPGPGEGHDQGAQSSQFSERGGGPRASNAVHEGLVTFWELLETRSSHTARRIICSLESATSWTGSCITSAGVSVRKARAEDLAHGPVDQSQLRSCLRKRKALLLQEAPRVFLQGLPALQTDLILGLVLRAPLPRASQTPQSWRRVKLWPNIPSRPGSVQDEIWRAQWKSSSGSWGAAQKMDRRSSG